MPDRSAARARAIRAARAVTLGLATAATATACAESHEGRERDDASIVADAGRGDAGCTPWTGGTPPATQECCEGMGFWWDPSRGSCIVAVPGPFVPPSLGC